MPHQKGSQEAKDHMNKIRKTSLIKGSQEAKEYMQQLRDKKKSKIAPLEDKQKII